MNNGEMLELLGGIALIIVGGIGAKYFKRSLGESNKYEKADDIGLYGTCIMVIVLGFFLVVQFFSS